MRTIKAELYDRIHNIIGSYNDRMIHLYFEYDRPIDGRVLGAALEALVSQAPVFGSSFKKGVIRHRWIVREHTTDELLTVVRCDDPRAAAYLFLCAEIPKTDRLQLKAGLFTDGEVSVLAMIANHMCVDARDFIYFAGVLCRAYDELGSGGSAEGVLKNGSRGYRGLYRDLSPEDAKKAKRLYHNPISSDKREFPLTPPSAADATFILRHTVPAECFDGIKSYGKERGGTVNDMILAAFFLAFYDSFGVGADESVTVSSAIDLRRHIKDSSVTGVTNFSSYLPYKLESKPGGFDEALAAVTDISKRYKTDPFTGLYGLPLLSFGFRAFPAFLGDALVKKFYNNPLIGVSNFGVLEPDRFRLDGSAPVDCFGTGTVKFKPGALISVTTYDKSLSLSMCAKGNDADKYILEGFLDKVSEHLTGRDLRSGAISSRGI